MVRPKKVGMTRPNKKRVKPAEDVLDPVKSADVAKPAVCEATLAQVPPPGVQARWSPGKKRVVQLLEVAAESADAYHLQIKLVEGYPKIIKKTKRRLRDWKRVARMGQIVSNSYRAN